MAFCGRKIINYSIENFHNFVVGFCESRVLSRNDKSGYYYQQRIPREGQSQSTMPTFPVELAVYDLSRGMAGQLSAQFLGPQYAIDIIPHTALVVYGREYFFGGGIQHEDPNRFRLMRGIHPIRVISLGHTSVSREEFHTWCQNCTDSGKYAPASYDLLANNCNNFSHDAAIGGLKLSEGVPDWILDVPRKFLSSPMGQMIRPILENMQMRAGTDGSSAPFSNVPTNAFSTTPAISSTPSSNPWANMSESTSKSTIGDEKISFEPKALRMNTTPILDSYCKPLVSSEYKTVELCVKKISSVLEEADKEALQNLGRVLTTTKSLNGLEVEQCSQIILTALRVSGSTVITFALMFLRVIVLKSTGAEKSMKECLEWIEDRLVISNELSSSDNLLISSHTARTMAWLTLANSASLPWWNRTSEKLLDAVFIDWAHDTQPRADVRQAAAAFAYNYVLLLPLSTTIEENEVTDINVSLLCGSLESIVEETDATAQLRRLLVAARILVPKDAKVQDGDVKTLMEDLGFPDIIRDLQESSDTMIGNAEDAIKCKKLAGEMLELLQ